MRIFRHTLATGEPYLTRERAELRLDRGVVEYYEWRLERITLPDGERGLVCYFRDISAQVAARKAVEESREALKDADRRKDEFLATLAHELRTPLAPIHNALQILRLTGRDGAVARSVHDMMERQVNHMVRLVDDLHGGVAHHARQDRSAQAARRARGRRRQRASRRRAR